MTVLEVLQLRPYVVLPVAEVRRCAELPGASFDRELYRLIGEGVVRRFQMRESAHAGTVPLCTDWLSLTLRGVPADLRLTEKWKTQHG